MTEENLLMKRTKLYSLDKNAKRRFSHENQDVQKMYEEYFVKPNSQKSHMLLHTEHKLEGFKVKKLHVKKNIKYVKKISKCY